MVVLIADCLGVGEVIALFGILTYLAIYYLPISLAIVVILLPVTATYFKLRRLNLYWQDRGISGPVGNILVGSKVALFSDINGFDSENFEKYGDTFGAVLAGTPDLVTKDVGFIKTVFNAEFDAFTDREDISNFFPKESFFSSWLTILKGDDWKRVRQRLTPAFTTAKMRKLLVPMEYCAKELNAELEKYAEEKAEIDVKDLFGKLTMNVIGRSAFALDLKAFNQKEEHPFLTHGKRIFEITMIDPLFMFVVFFPNVEKLIRRVLGWKTLVLRDLHDFFLITVSSIIDQRIKNPEAAESNVDALQLMINAIESDEVMEASKTSNVDAEFVSENVQNAKLLKKTVTKQEIVAQSTLFLLAGYETTATTLQFALYCLTHFPKIQDKARSEVKEVFGDKNSLNFDDISKLVYVKQVIHETLRMFAAASRVTRTCNRAIRINDIDFEPGVTFTAQVRHVHYDENNYPDPYKFDPERFSPECRADRDPGAFLPFGGGPRSCIGMRFAEFEMLMTLAHLLRRFRFLPSAVDAFEWPIPLDPVVLTRPVKKFKVRVEALN
uniref:Cytochrome P450 n=1 Tax=Panagrellus redivivus TaxID=6233 RepID=A0A7E4VSY1_PANRE